MKQGAPTVTGARIGALGSRNVAKVRKVASTVVERPGLLDGIYRSAESEGLPGSARTYQQ